MGGPLVTAAEGARRAVSTVRWAPPGRHPGDAQRLGRGSARILESLGFEAVATTSSGFAATLGRMDQRVTLAELLAHAAALTKRWPSRSASTPSTATPKRRMGSPKPSTCSGRPASPVSPSRTTTPLRAVPARCRRGTGRRRRRGSRRHAVVLTARSENHLYGVTDLDDTITRLHAFRAAGADVVYAPGLAELLLHLSSGRRNRCAGQCAATAARAGRPRSRRRRGAQGVDRRIVGFRRLRSPRRRRP